MLMSAIKRNKRTTWAGIGSLLCGVGTLVGAYAKGSFSPDVIVPAIGLVTTGIGLIFGKDVDK